MTENYEGEVDLTDFIELVLKRKRLIISATLLCGLVTALFVLLQPRQYEAKALIVVSPAITSSSQSQQDDGSQGAPGVDIVVPGLAAQTYEALSKGDELLDTLKDSLLKVGLRPELAAELARTDLDELSDRMEVNLLEATEKAKSPLLSFRARSAAEDLPVDMVNLWADLFVERHRGLSSGWADDYYQWVQAQYKAAKENLENTEDRLREVSAGYHTLSVLKNEVAVKTNRMGTALRAYQSKATSLQDRKLELVHLRNRLEGVEWQGAWLGFASPDALPVPSRLSPDVSAARRDLVTLLRDVYKTEQDSVELAENHEQVRRKHDTRVKLERFLFEQETSSAQLAEEVGHLDSLLVRYRSQATYLDRESKDLAIRERVLEANLAEEPQALLVAKAITDEALWEEATDNGRVNDGNVRALGKYRLTSEELNPTHLKLSAKIRDLKVQRDLADIKASFLGDEIPSIESALLIKRAKLDSLSVPDHSMRHRHERERMALDSKQAREARPIEERLRRKREAVAGYHDEYETMRRRAEIRPTRSFVAHGHQCSKRAERASRRQRGGNFYLIFVGVQNGADT